MAKFKEPSPPQALLGILGIKPNNIKIFSRALTHRSLLNESGLAGDSNETMEFLGDAVLGLAISEMLYRKYPELTEGQLARRKSALVSATTLAKWARSINLGLYLKVGHGEEITGGRDKDTLLADGLEALIGAVYLDLGLVRAQALIDNFLDADLVSNDAGKGGDPKSRLQEWVQKRYKKPPTYRLAATKGPDHAKIFSIEVVLGNTVIATGVGKNKKEAEQKAAEVALEVLLAKFPAS